MPKISIIIPVYNVEKYLRECLDSAISQTLKDIEIICVNDGSTDNSLNILKEYSQKDNRIKIIDLKKNVGIGKARNIAFKEITAPYVMYLDSDDWYELNTCELVYNQIVKNNNDMVLFAFSSCRDKINKKTTHDVFKLKSYENCPNIKYMNLEKPYSFLAPWYKIYSVKFLKENNISFEEGVYYEDMQFFYNITFANPDFSIIFKSLYNHRVRQGSIVTLSCTFDDEIQVRNRLLKKCVDFGNEKYLKFFIISYINTIYKKYKKYSNKDIVFKYRNYSRVRNIFKNLDKIVPICSIKEEIDKYNEIIKIINSTLIEFVIKNILKNIFSIKNSKNKSHKIITILGIKFKIKRNKNQ